MEVVGASSTKVAVAETITQIEDPIASLTDRRVSASFKKAAEATSEDGDADVDEGDSGIAEDAAKDTLESFESKMSGDGAEDFVESVLETGLGSGQADTHDDLVEKIVEDIDNAGLIDATAKQVEAGDSVILVSDDGVRKEVTLEEGEDSKLVVVGDEVVVVVDQSLSAEEAQAATANTLFENITVISSQYGLHIVYEPFMQALHVAGYSASIEVYGTYVFPASMVRSNNAFFDAEQRMSDVTSQKNKRETEDPT